jgi:type I restriction-modification system DNA methylase subunit
VSRQHIRDIAKLMQANAHRRRLDQVFADAVEMMALAISNGVDLAQFEAREARYMQVVKDYTPEEVSRFPQMLALLVDALEGGPADILGAVFGELEQGNSARGQFFTPYEICRLMARMTVGDGHDIRAKISERGYITLQEPSAGAGAQVIAFAEAMQESGLNYQQHLHTTAIDVDSRAVHMAYVQFSLLGIPALVYTGNTLTMEMREVWRTPMHLFGMWDSKLRRGYALGSEMDGEPVDQPTPEEAPQPAADIRLAAFLPSVALCEATQPDLFEAFR